MHCMAIRLLRLSQLYGNVAVATQHAVWQLDGYRIIVTKNSVLQ